MWKTLIQQEEQGWELRAERTTKKGFLDERAKKLAPGGRLKQQSCCAEQAWGMGILHKCKQVVFIAQQRCRHA